MTDIYLNSLIDPGVVNEYLIEKKDKLFYKHFIHQCRKIINDKNAVFKTRQRALKFLNSFIGIDGMTSNVLEETGLYSLNTLYRLKAGEETIVDNTENQENEKGRLLMDLFNRENNSELAKIENSLRTICLLYNIKYEKNQIISILDQLVLQNTIGNIKRNQRRSKALYTNRHTLQKR